MEKREILSLFSSLSSTINLCCLCKQSRTSFLPSKNMNKFTIIKKKAEFSFPLEADRNSSSLSRQSLKLVSPLKTNPQICCSSQDKASLHLSGLASVGCTFEVHMIKLSEHAVFLKHLLLHSYQLAL